MKRKKGIDTLSSKHLHALCVAKAEQQPEQRLLLKAEKSWERHDFVVKAGWVANVSEKYRTDVARACALAVGEAMEAKPTATPPK